MAPRVPTEKGGDNSIQSYGLEADSSERIEAAAIVQAYLSAQAEGNWAGACALLSAKISANLQALARRAQGQEGGGCGPAMELLLGKAPKGALATLAQIEVLSLRVQGDNGFLIYRDGKGAATELLLARAGGGWRVDALAGNALG